MYQPAGRNYLEEALVSHQTRHGARLGLATRAATFAAPVTRSLLPALLRTRSLRATGRQP